MSKRNALLAGAIILLAGATVRAQGFDVVVLHDKTRKSGTVTKMSKEKVVVEHSGIEDELEVRDIARITFARAPRVFHDARKLMDDGRFADALSDLRGIDLGSVSREVVAQEIEYYVAYCEAKAAMEDVVAKKKAAIAGMLAFVKKYPSTYHFYEAAELLGDLSASVGDFAEAATYYTSVGKAPWSDYKLRAAVLLGQARLSQGQYPEAQQGFDYVLNSNLQGPSAQRQKLLAGLGKAVCLAHGDKPDQGIAVAEKIIAEGDPADAPLFARAYMALGACYEAQGKTMDALLAYLHVDLLFYQDAALHAEALYHLEKLWTKAKRPDRALKARTLLKSRYPGSVWAQQ